MKHENNKRKYIMQTFTSNPWFDNQAEVEEAYSDDQHRTGERIKPAV
jgi:hypothetical protein